MHQQLEHIPRFVLTPVLRLRAVLEDYDFEFAELLSGLAGLLWGIWLILPWQTFASSTSFRVLADIGLPEIFWGGYIALLGIAQFSGMAFDRWHIRRYASFGMFLTWLFLSVMFGIANPAGTGIVVYPLLAFSSCWAYWRMRLVR